MGQLFFYSMSLAMGILILRVICEKRMWIWKNHVSQIKIFDTGIAFIAGLMVSAVFVFNNGDAAAMDAGPS